MSAVGANISQKLDTLADRVERYDLGAASRLRQLSVALEDGILAEEWAASDLYRLIDQREIIDQVRMQVSSDRLVAVVELVRNVLLFLPILVTWFGIARAVDGYYRLVQANHATTQTPFLFLWQDGFGRQVWPTLGQLGLINGGLLLLVIALTIFGLVRSTLLSIARERFAENLRRELSEALAIAALTLQTLSRRTPTSLIEHFRELAERIIGQIEAERMRIADMGEQRDRELTVLNRFSSELRLSTQELLESAQSSGQTYHDLLARVAALSAPIENLATTAQQLLNTGQHVAAPLTQLVTQQASVGEQLSAAAHGMDRAATETAAAARGVVGATQEVTRLQSAFLADLQAERQAQASLAASVAQTARDLTSVGQSLQQNTNALASSIGQITAPVQSLAEQGESLSATSRSLEETTRQIVVQQATIVAELSTALHKAVEASQLAAQTLDRSVGFYERSNGAQAGFLDALAEERNAQTEIARVVSRSTTDFENSLEAVRQVSVSLHAIAVDMSEISRTLPPLSRDGRNS